METTMALGGSDDDRHSSLAAPPLDGEVSCHVPSLSPVSVQVRAGRLELAAGVHHAPLLVGVDGAERGPRRRGVLVAAVRDAVVLLDVLVLGDVVLVAEVDGEDVAVGPDRVQEDGHGHGLGGDGGEVGREDDAAHVRAEHRVVDVPGEGGRALDHAHRHGHLAGLDVPGAHQVDGEAASVEGGERVRGVVAGGGEGDPVAAGGPAAVGVHPLAVGEPRHRALAELADVGVVHDVEVLVRPGAAGPVARRPEHELAPVRAARREGVVETPRGEPVLVGAAARRHVRDGVNLQRAPEGEGRADAHVQGVLVWVLVPRRREDAIGAPGLQTLLSWLFRNLMINLVVCKHC